MSYEIGPRLRRYREIKGLSQKEFARLMGVSNSRVSNWELGINRPDADIIAKICEVLTISADELLDIKLSANNKQNAPEPATTSSEAKEEEIYQMLKKLVADLHIDLSALTDRQKIALEIISNIIADNF